MSGYLCRCTICGREEHSGRTPLRDGWPKCHDLTMRLVESERFIEDVDAQTAAAFGNATVAGKAADLLRDAAAGVASEEARRA